MQEQIQRHKAKPVKEHSADAEVKQLEPDIDEDALNAVLDEIDAVLEENAHEFVRSYIQQGGQ